uniref:VQ domain-containing protein n=1 Tax=Kalanchoe fedtschenkoi TaxID=63787 RepID=A0A7N0RDU8_KALFE
MEAQQRSSYPSPLNSPTSYGSSSVNPAQTPPLTPKAITRSDPSSPYPTTFVQADTSSFKQVVQMLTGSSDPPKPAASNSNFTFSKSSIPPIRNPQKKQPSSKLYERRNQLRNNLMINTLASNNNMVSVSPRRQEMLSPSMLDFPKLVLSPVTPLMEDIFNNGNKSSTPSTANSNASEEEDKAIAEKGFYFHPSPRNSATPKGAEPQLLSLFPVTAQRVSGTS